MVRKWRIQNLGGLSISSAFHYFDLNPPTELLADDPTVSMVRVSMSSDHLVQSVPFFRGCYPEAKNG